MRLMKQARINIATLPVFGWAALQPNENTWTFDWLDDILDRLASNNIRACLATATASVPAWLSQKYPDVLVTDERGHKHRHGQRHTFCPNSPNFRRLSTQLAGRIAERYKDHPALLLWHVGNEYGTHCFCEQCAGAFRLWLQGRYGSLEELNRRWYTTFWGHTFSDWEQVEPPFANGERSIQALRLDYTRFQSASLLSCYKGEARVLREATPDVPITTNLMGAFFNLDYHEWAREMDIVSWDNYPGPSAPPPHVAFAHALMRGLKEGQPFLLMEQSPSQQNWQPYNWLKPPGLLRLQSFQALAQGADSVMYFQWRRGRAGIEKLHGAVIEHPDLPDARVFGEVSDLGADLEVLGTRTLGQRVAARVAILFSWENWWALSFSSGPSVDLKYVDVCRDFYSALHLLGIQVEVVSPDADLSRFDVILAPVLTMIRDEQAASIGARVQEGATFVATFFSGLVDEADMVHPNGAPGPLREVLGLRIEETDALPPGKSNGLVFEQPFGDLAADVSHPAGLLCDRVRLEGAEIVARYAWDFYAGEPALSRNQFGNGRAYYLATRPDAATLRALLHAVCAEHDIAAPIPHLPENVEVTLREGQENNQNSTLYLLNHNLEPVEVELGDGKYLDLLLDEAQSHSVTIQARGVRVLRRV